MKQAPVIIESPYAGRDPTHYRRNVAYLRAAILDCLRRGEVPYASHGLYPGALDDTDAEQRKLGIEAGFRTAEFFQQVGGYRVFYVDRGQSTGMRYGQEHADVIGQLHIPRSLGEEWSVDNDPKHCDHHKLQADAAEPCDDCGAELVVATLPRDAYEAALDFLKKKA